LTLREERGRKLFENRVLRKVFVSEREVTGGWRKLHDVELRDLLFSPDVIRLVRSRGMRRAGSVALAGEQRNAYRVLVGKPEGKRPLGRLRRRWNGDNNNSNNNKPVYPSFLGISYQLTPRYHDGSPLRQ
jgi:hypothetical protein